MKWKRKTVRRITRYVRVYPKGSGPGFWELLREHYAKHKRWYRKKEILTGWNKPIKDEDIVLVDMFENGAIIMVKDK
jgi:hypothetical protein